MLSARSCCQLARARQIMTRRGPVMTSSRSLASEKIGQNRGPVTWASFAVAGVAGGGLVLYYQYEKERLQTQVHTKQKTVGKPALGGPFTLVNCQGEAMTDKSFFGDWLLIYFGFTHCPDICPNELVKMGGVIDALDKKGKDVKPVFISVDPHRDSVDQVAFYLKDFNKKFVGLTGTKDQVEEATRAYRVYFNKADEHDEDEDDYLVDHSIVMYLINPEGEFEEFFTQSAEYEEIVKRSLDTINGWSPSS